MPSSLRLQQRPAFCLSRNSLLIASTYQLDGDSRDGSFYFLSPYDLSISRWLPTPAGVFRFEIINNDSLCVSALTDGSLHSISLSDYSSQNVSVSSDMLLDVSISGNNALTTNNKGQVFLVDMLAGSVTAEWLGHKLPYTNDPCEVWSTALSDNLACTGGEDAVLRLWDVRSRVNIAMCKVFNAGVTYADWVDDNVILTGSYDQHIRTLDIRKLSAPLTQTETLGGVWHIESRGVGLEKQYLASCMYGGWALFDHAWELLQRDEEAGKELLYGVAFTSPNSIAYTTFNDYSVSTAELSL